MVSFSAFRGVSAASLLVLAACGDHDERRRTSARLDAATPQEEPAAGPVHRKPDEVLPEQPGASSDDARDAASAQRSGEEEIDDASTASQEVAADANLPIDARVETAPPPASPVDNPRAPVKDQLLIPAGLANLAPTAQDLLVAFIGDQGNSADSAAVLALIKREGAQAAVHNGDFDYSSSPKFWNDRIDAILGPDFPYFATIGNHDAPAWTSSADVGGKGYRDYIEERYARIPEAVCSFVEHGTSGTCVYRGLLLVQSCVGVVEFGPADSALRDRCVADGSQVAFLRDALAQRHQLWAICSWHKNQSDMQVGFKADETGWQAYRTCMNGGAIISTGHEHSYSRTRTLTDLGNPAVSYGVTGSMDDLQIGFGRTFVFVSGLGGYSVRALNPAHREQAWLAAAYTSDNWRRSGVWQTRDAARGTYGALFIRFNPAGQVRKAKAYFKDVTGRIADEFEIALDTADPR